MNYPKIRRPGQMSNVLIRHMALSALAVSSFAMDIRTLTFGPTPFGAPGFPVQMAKAAMSWMCFSRQNLESWCIKESKPCPHQ